MSVQSAPVPDTIAALRVQNGALRTLNRCLEEEIKLHREKARQYHVAIETLQSERDANARLTEEVERLLSLKDALGSKVSNLTQQLDAHYGTPCAQISWQQERDEMRELLDKAFEAMCAARPVSGDDEAFQDAIDEIGLYCAGNPHLPLPTPKGEAL